MSDTKANDAAFPFQSQDQHGGLYAPEFGLTKREYFAGLAMQGILASGDQSMLPLQRVAKTAGMDIDKALGMTAVTIADALLAALKETAHD